MKKAAMNRKKRLDAPSKQELRERYESARRNAKEDGKEDLSTTSEVKTILYILYSGIQLLLLQKHFNTAVVFRRY